jgi:type II secretory ATPase GspE/PulE/Tfp pilus assembly ATPase PilB-like protein
MPTRKVRTGGARGGGTLIADDAGITLERETGEAGGPAIVRLDYEDLISYSFTLDGDRYRLQLYPREETEPVEVEGISHRDREALEDLLQNALGERRQVLMRPEARPLSELRDAVDEIFGTRGMSEGIQFVLSAAWGVRATDVHFESTLRSVRIRFRIDGVLHEVTGLVKGSEDQLFTSLKVLARLISYEKKKNQEGRIETFGAGSAMDLRVSIVPTVHGEKAVVRLLPPSEWLPDLEGLGMPEGVLDAYRRLLHTGRGLVLLTGPCSSGKTTTIFSSVRFLQREGGERVSISTIEDPPEYALDGVNQTQVDPERGITMAAGLRALLRQDPDILVVDEIRDRETADAAFQAGLLGHLVFSTVHAGEVPGLFARLRELGLPSAGLGLAVRCVINQRLVRMICEGCRVERPEDERWDEAWGEFFREPFARAFVGRGCGECDGTGYRGRTGLFEMVPVTDEIGEALRTGAGSGELESICREAAVIGFEQDARRKVAAGVTTPEEVLARIGER